MFYQKIKDTTDGGKSLRFSEGHPQWDTHRFAARKTPVLNRICTYPPIRPVEYTDDTSSAADSARHHYAAYMLGIFTTQGSREELGGTSLWEKLLAWEALDTPLACCCHRIRANFDRRAAVMDDMKRNQRVRKKEARAAEQVAATGSAVRTLRPAADGDHNNSADEFTDDDDDGPLMPLPHPESGGFYDEGDEEAALDRLDALTNITSDASGGNAHSRHVRAHARLVLGLISTHVSNSKVRFFYILFSTSFLVIY